MPNNKNIESEFEELAWQNMKSILDQQMPEKKENKFIYFWITGIAASLLLLFLLIQTNKKKTSTQPDMAASSVIGRGSVEKNNIENQKESKEIVNIRRNSINEKMIDLSDNNYQNNKDNYVIIDNKTRLDEKISNIDIATKNINSSLLSEIQSSNLRLELINNVNVNSQIFEKINDHKKNIRTALIENSNINNGKDYNKERPLGNVNVIKNTGPSNADLSRIPQKTMELASTFKSNPRMAIINVPVKSNNYSDRINDHFQTGLFSQAQSSISNQKIGWKIGGFLSYNLFDKFGFNLRLDYSRLPLKFDSYDDLSLSDFNISDELLAFSTDPDTQLQLIDNSNDLSFVYTTLGLGLEAQYSLSPKWGLHSGIEYRQPIKSYSTLNAIVNVEPAIDSSFEEMLLNSTANVDLPALWRAKAGLSYNISPSWALTSEIAMDLNSSANNGSLNIANRPQTTSGSMRVNRMFLRTGISYTF